MIALLAIVEVPPDERVRCQAVGCNHPVFKRIHVVRENAAIHVYGSACFKQLFHGQAIAASTPHYTSSDGRHLSDEERQLLLENTERLIQQFEEEYQAKLAHTAPLHPVPPPPPPLRGQAIQPVPPTELRRRPSSAERAVAELQAKALLREKFCVDPDLPGWRGLVLVETERILQKNTA